MPYAFPPTPILDIGGAVILLVVAYLIYQFTRTIRASADVDEKIYILEGVALDKIAKKKGIDLDKEAMKKCIIKKQRKNFYRKIKDDIYEEMFGKEKEDK